MRHKVQPCETQYSSNLLFADQDPFGLPDRNPLGYTKWNVRITPIIWVHVHAEGQEILNTSVMDWLYLWDFIYFLLTDPFFVSKKTDRILTPGPPWLPQCLQQVLEWAWLQPSRSCPERMMWADCDGLANGVWRCPWRFMAMPISMEHAIYKYITIIFL